MTKQKQKKYNSQHTQENEHTNTQVYIYRYIDDCSVTYILYILYFVMMIIVIWQQQLRPTLVETSLISIRQILVNL